MKSVYDSNEHQVMKEQEVLIVKMEGLQENQILIKVVKFLTPIWILGICGLFSPFFYAILPVHATDICLCQFFIQKEDASWRAYPLLFIDSYGPL
jgi:hypothetical protein